MQRELKKKQNISEYFIKKNVLLKKKPLQSISSFSNYSISPIRKKNYLLKINL